MRAPSSRQARVPRLSPLKIVANALSRNEGRAELALQAAIRLGNVVRFPVPGKSVFLVTHPDDLRRVMIQNAANYRKSFDYQILARLLGQGLLTSEGEIWRQDRRLQQPLFHGKALEHFFSTLLECVDALVSSWKAPTEITLEAEMTRFGLHVIGRRIVSLDIRKWSDEISWHLNVCQRQIVARGLALVDFARWLPTPGERRFEKSLAVLYRIVGELIDERAAMGPGPYDLYSILAEQDYPRERMRDQFLTLFLAGHETTAIALTWLYACIARHPEVEPRLAAEARSALGPDGRLAWDGVEKLVYTRQVIDEGLRLYPPVAFMGRESIGDDVLGGYPIPAGSIIVLCPYATHRRPDLWENADAFDPQRFTDDRRARLPACAHIPFAAGPRGCIGQHFAMLELQALVSAVALRFRLRLVDEAPIRPVPLVSLRPSRPVRMRVLPPGRP